MTNVNAPSSISPDALQLLALHDLFADAPEDVLQLIVDGAFDAQRGAGEYFFHEGEPARRYLLLKEGRVEMVRVAFTGQERLAKVFESGQLVAEAAMFMSHGIYPMSARATTESSALCLGRDPLNAACLRYPPLALRLLEALSGRLYHTVNEVSALATTSASQRLAAYLAEQSHLQGSVRIELSLAPHQLAGHLGIRPETLSRMLGQWSQKGYVSGRGRTWELLDRDALQRLAEAAVRPL